MRRIEIAQITALLFVASTMALTASHHQSTTAQTIGQVHGTVVDVNDARVAGATVTVEGEGATRAVTTAEDGTYRIELPIGIYRIRVNSRGFCPARRAPFRVQPSTDIMLNFTLTVCPIVYGITVVNGQYTGETDRYQDPFKEEVFPLAHSSGARLELLLRYKERREDRSTIEYREATLSYDALMIHADKILLDRKTFQVEAEGSVIFEDGRQSIRARHATVNLRSGRSSLKIDLLD